jgi:hypothetical protein
LGFAPIIRIRNIEIGTIPPETVKPFPLCAVLLIVGMIAEAMNCLEAVLKWIVLALFLHFFETQ